MNQAEILAKVASGEIKPEEAQKLLAAEPKRGLYCKVSPKGGLSVYGLQRMPVTLSLPVPIALTVTSTTPVVALPVIVTIASIKITIPLSVPAAVQALGLFLFPQHVPRTAVVQVRRLPLAVAVAFTAVHVPVPVSFPYIAVTVPVSLAISVFFVRPIGALNVAATVAFPFVLTATHMLPVVAIAARTVSATVVVAVARVTVLVPRRTRALSITATRSNRSIVAFVRVV